MTASTIRETARKSLEGKWEKSALLTLCFVLFLWLANLVISFIGGTIPILAVLINVAWFVIITPIGFGILTIFIKIKRENADSINYFDFLKFAFSNFGKVWNVFGNMLLKMLPLVLGIILGVFFIVFGVALLVLSFNYSFMVGIGFILYLVCLVLLIPKSFSYAFSYAILYDNPNMSGMDIVEKSEALMKNNRWKLFCLYFSFIGWNILCAFTFGIGYLWLIPYVMVSFAVFYDNLIDSSEPVTSVNSISPTEPITNIESNTTIIDSLSEDNVIELND